LTKFYAALTNSLRYVRRDGSIKLALARHPHDAARQTAPWANAWLSSWCAVLSQWVEARSHLPV